MKKAAPAYILLLTVTLLVTLNAAFLTRRIDGYIEEIAAVSPEGSETYDTLGEIFERFSRDYRWISLTVSHEDLMSIEDAFAEILGAAKIEEREEVAITKSRLIHALRHLRRLSSLNIDSIF